MKYFSIQELSNSNTAKQKGIDNTPNLEITENLTQLIDHILDPLREKYGKPIIVNSGYRCPKLNKCVGGVSTSQHVKGQAADITGKSAIENKKLFNLIIDLDLPYDQVIDEKNYSWIHVSYTKNPRKQILHL